MYQLTLRVNPFTHKQSKIVPGILTKRMHAFVLASIQKQDPELSANLHEQKQRQQFAIYVNEPHIVVRSPKKEIALALRECWQFDPRIDLNSWKGEVANIELRYLSLAEIKNSYHSNVTIKFLTPTTFYQDGNYYPLPEMNRLLLSANKIYPMIEQPMVPLEQINHIARTIRIENLCLHSQRVHFGKFSVIGFQGKLSLNLKALSPSEQSTAWMLFSMGAQLGFGYKTAWGLGQVEMKMVRK